MFLKLHRVQLATVILIMTGIGYSCTNNDTNDPDDITTTVTTGDTSMMMADTAIHIDTMAVRTDTTGSTITRSTAGTAKPNPAKKGMKGKVVVTAPVKPTGSMEADNTGVYSNVEYIPSFPGGNKGLQNYFDKNIQYPEDATTEGVEGVVNVAFVVDENGKLTGLTTQGQRLGYGLEEEALRVVRNMPSWNPGKLKGANVKTRYTLPVRFELY